MLSYYAELTNDGNNMFSIVSLGYVPREEYPERVLRTTKGVIREITEKEYYLLSACKGNISQGIYLLANLQEKLGRFAQENS